MKATLQKEPRTNENVCPPSYIMPEVNIFENQEGYVVEAEMPGVNKNGIEVTLEGNALTILGHRTRERIEGEPLLRECLEADFRRVFELDPAIDTSRIVARMDQGILKLTLPKSERVKPRKIAIE